MEASVTASVRRPADLAGLRRSVRRLLMAHRVDEPTVQEILLAVQEAAKNGLTFGDTAAPDATVTVSVTGADVLVEVADTGSGFPGDPEQVPLAGPLDEHGRGLFLMRRFMDTLEVVPSRVGTNVRMTRHLGPPKLRDAERA